MGGYITHASMHVVSKCVSSSVTVTSERTVLAWKINNVTSGDASATHRPLPFPLPSPYIAFLLYSALIT